MQIFTKKLLPGRHRPKAIAFVDYEHWCISMLNLHSIRPDIKKWHTEITEKYDIIEIVFFGDFSGSLRQDLDRIRSITNLVIDTKNPNERYIKDYTDFIMLDYIYRKSISTPKVNTYIIFTGDGHFFSVINFLQSVCKKKVVLYGVKNAISQTLKDSVTDCNELPHEKDMENYCMDLIIKNFDHVLAQPAGKVHPTFQTTVDIISKNNSLPSELVKSTLIKMIEKGYINQKMERIRYKEEIRILAADWDLLIKDGLWKA